MKLWKSLAAIAASAAVAARAFAQSWPTWPVKVFVPFASGGSTDIIALVTAT